MLVFLLISRKEIKLMNVELKTGNGLVNCDCVTKPPLRSARKMSVKRWRFPEGEAPTCDLVYFSFMTVPVLSSGK